MLNTDSSFHIDDAKDLLRIICKGSHVLLEPLNILDVHSQIQAITEIAPYVVDLSHIDDEDISLLPFADDEPNTAILTQCAAIDDVRFIRIAIKRTVPADANHLSPYDKRNISIAFQRAIKVATSNNHDDVLLELVQACSRFKQQYDLPVMESSEDYDTFNFVLHFCLTHNIPRLKRLLAKEPDLFAPAIIEYLKKEQTRRDNVAMKIKNFMAFSQSELDFKQLLALLPILLHRYPVVNEETVFSFFPDMIALVNGENLELAVTGFDNSNPVKDPATYAMLCKYLKKASGDVSDLTISSVAYCLIKYFHIPPYEVCKKTSDPIFHPLIMEQAFMLGYAQ